MTMKSYEEKEVIRRKMNRSTDPGSLFEIYFIKKTPARVAIARIFQTSEKSLSAKNVLEISKMENPQNPLSSASVYRVIKVLEENRFLRQSHIEKDTIYYEI